MRTRLSVQSWAILPVVLWISAATVHAQTIGTFRWRLAPHCNVVNLTVEQRGSIYVLTGYDDQCGAQVRAAASGTAHLNPDGSVGMGFTVLRPDGRALPTTVTLSLATVSGSWSDAYGNTGLFEFNPSSSPGGQPRRITLRGSYAIQIRATGAGINVTDTISFGTVLDSAPTTSSLHFIDENDTPTAECPGTPTDPQASPGHLCVYERTATNVTNPTITSTGVSYTSGQADPFGASILMQSVAAGQSASVGSWAVTIP